MTNLLEFPIKEKPLAIVDPATGLMKSVTTHKAIVRPDPDTGRATQLGIVGIDYKPVLNADYFSAIDEALTLQFGDAQVKTKDTMSGGGAWCQREYIVPSVGRTIRTNTGWETETAFRAIGWNSYDGSTSLGLLAGLIDWYCTNGLFVGTHIAKASRRHTKNVTPASLVPYLHDSANRVIEEMAHIQMLATTKLNHQSAVEWLESKFSKTRANRMVEQLDEEIQTRGDNLFALHSALTAYSSHDSERFGVRNRGQDNVARTLHNRSMEIAPLMQSLEALAA